MNDEDSGEFVQVHVKGDSSESDETEAEDSGETEDTSHSKNDTREDGPVEANRGSHESDEGKVADVTDSGEFTDEETGTVVADLDPEKWNKKIEDHRRRLRSTSDEGEKEELRDLINDLESRLKEAGVYDEELATPDQAWETESEEDSEMDRSSDEPEEDSEEDTDRTSQPADESTDQTDASGESDSTRPRADRVQDGIDEPQDHPPDDDGLTSEKEQQKDTETKATDIETNRDTTSGETTRSTEDTSGRTSPETPNSTESEIAQADPSDSDDTDTTESRSSHSQQIEEETSESSESGDILAESQEQSASRTEDGGPDTEQQEARRSELDEAIERIDDLEELVNEYRRKNKREHEMLKKEALEDFATRMLKVRDTLLRMIEYNDWDDSDEEQLQVILDQFDQNFTNKSIDTIDPDRGDEVDELRHSLAGPRKESSDVGSNRVLHLEQKGFEISGYPIRPAEVIATKRN